MKKRGIRAISMNKKFVSSNWFQSEKPMQPFELVDSVVGDTL